MFGVPSALSPYLTPGGMYESVSLYSIWGKKQVKQVFFFKNCLTLEQVKFYFISKSTTEFSPTFKTLFHFRRENKKNNVANLRHGMTLWNA